jgi:nucleotide-binding universal stress UspA family protein
VSLWTHIGVCLDDSPGSGAALAEAQRVRAEGPGRLSLLHVVFGVQEEDTDVQKAGDWLDGLAAGVPGAEAVLLVNLGTASGAVCSWASETGVDLLVASAHRGWRERAMLGSFAGDLARHSPCSVLLVRPPQEQPATAEGPAG